MRIEDAGHRGAGRRAHAAGGAVLIALVALAGRGDAHAPKFTVDTLEAFAVQAEHIGDITSDENFPFTTGVNWAVFGEIKEDSGWDWDSLTIMGKAWHVLAPHGEAENTSQFTWDFFVNGSVWDETLEDGASSGVRSLPPIAATLTHESHLDKYVANLVFTIEWDEDILGYLHTVSGKHTDDRTGHRWRPYAGSLASEDRADSQAFGNVVGFIEPEKGLLDMSARVLGLRAEDVTKAHLHLGKPGTDSPVIFRLGRESLVTEEDGLSILVSEAAFPARYVEAFLDGQAWLHVHTQRFPKGELAGVLRPVKRQSRAGASRK